VHAAGLGSPSVSAWRTTDLADRLEGLLAAAGLEGEVQDLRRLTGGASRETWSFDLATDEGPRPLILQRSRPGTVSGGPGMAGEAALLRAAGAHGVPVPRVVVDHPDALGGPSMVLQRLAGETIARRLLRDERWSVARDRLVSQAGRALAAIHRIPPEAAPQLRAPDQLDEMAALLHGLDEPLPALELAVRWLTAHKPVPGELVVVHGDFRLGNLVVGDDGLAGVLDWELAHLGHPVEDLGWFCVRAWRFGSALPAGGVGTREQLVASYQEASGRPVDPDELRWWEVLGTLKWALICVVQAKAHLSGATRSVELATIGRRVCESAWDLLGLLPGGPLPTGGGEPPPSPVPSLHGRPTAAELVEAVREWLQRDVVQVDQGRVGFDARVAGNALAMVERELALGRQQEVAHVARLAGLGCDDDQELARQIRRGDLDERADEVRQLVAADVRAQLEVANPRWLEPDV